MSEMKTFKQFLFILVAVMGLTLGVSAQKGGQQRPPKDPPPKIEPKPKPPKGDEKPKKPGFALFIVRTEDYESAD